MVAYTLHRSWFCEIWALRVSWITSDHIYTPKHTCICVSFRLSLRSNKKMKLLFFPDSWWLEAIGHPNWPTLRHYFRFLSFGDFSSTLPILLRAPSQCNFQERIALVQVKFNSCFMEYFTKFFKGHHLLMIGYFPLASTKDLFALTILTGPIV